MSFDRDFDHQQELFSDDSYYEAMSEVLVDDAESLSDFAQIVGGGVLGDKAILQKIKEIRERVNDRAHARLEMILEERRSGEVA